MNALLLIKFVLKTYKTFIADGLKTVTQISLLPILQSVTFAAHFFFMKDKNSIIGIVLLAVLFFTFFWYTNKQQQAFMTNQRRIEDSLHLDSVAKITPQQKAAARLDSIRNDSVAKVNEAGNFSNAVNTPEQTVAVENDLMKIVFTSKGGRVKSVELKKYNSNTGGKVVLGSSQNDEIDYAINTGSNRSAPTSQLNFAPSQPVKNLDGSQTIQFTLNNGGTSIIHQYIIKPNSYLIDWNIGMNGANGMLTNNALNFHFVSAPMQVEKSVDYERRMSDVCFSEGNEFDYISSKTDHTFEKPAQWISRSSTIF